MPSARSLTELITAAKRLSNQFQAGTGAALVVTADAEDRAQESLASLYEMMIDQGGSALLKKRVTITATQPVSDYVVELPTDFYKLVGIQWVNGTRRLPVRPLPPEDEALAYDLTGDEPLRYSLENVATQLAPVLLIFPVPTTALVFDVQYLPEAPLLANEISADPEPIPAVDVTLPNRWWQWVQYDMAAGFAQREEDDALEQSLLRRRNEIGAAILRSAGSTDYNEQRPIKDVRGALRGSALRDRDYWRGIDR